MTLNPQKQKELIMAFLGTVVVIYVVWYFGIQQQRKNRVAKDKEIAQLREEEKNKDNAIKKEKLNREQAKSYQTFISKFEEQMPKGNTETWLTRTLTEFAQKQKIQLANTVIQDVKDHNNIKFKGQPYKLIGFHLEFKADLNTIGKFLEDLENSIPLMEIYELSINAGSQEAVHIHTVSTTVVIPTKL